jgi:hypothetical protein
MRQWKLGAAVAIVMVALQAWGCGTEIAPQIETERRFQGSVQGPPPAPPVPFDMSLFLRKLASGQQGVTGGFSVNNGQLRGSVVGTLTGSLDEGTFAGRLIAAETRPTLANVMTPWGARRAGALFGFLFLPTALVAASMQDSGCIVEQQYTGTVTAAGIVWTPREVIRSCPTNPLNFAIQATPVVQQVTTSVSSTSTAPTTSTVSTTSTSTTTTTSVSTTTTSVPTTTSSTSTTTTSVIVDPPPTTTTIRPLGRP